MSLSLCDKINIEAESLTFLTGLTGLTRLGNESLLCDKIILTQRGKGAEEDEENSVSLSLCVKTHLRPREVVSVIISRFSSRSVYITFVAGRLGVLEIWSFKIFF